jgi:Methyltransferase small domain
MDRILTPNDILQKIKTTSGVFYPDECSIALADICVQYPGSVLDMGTGTGYVAIVCALADRSVDATEISRSILNCARANARAFSLERSIRFIQSNYFQSVPTRYDIIAFNPPKESQETVFSRWFKNTIQPIIPKTIKKRLSNLFFKIDASARRRELIVFINAARNHLGKDGVILLNLLPSDVQYMQINMNILFGQYCCVMQEKWTNIDRVIVALRFCERE